MIQCRQRAGRRHFAVNATVCSAMSPSVSEAVAALFASLSTARPCDRKANKPPGEALAERARLLGQAGSEPSVDLAAMADVIRLAFPGATPSTSATPNNTTPTNTTVLDEGLSA